VKRYLLLIALLCCVFALFAQTNAASAGGFQSTTNNSAYFYNGSISGSEQLKIYAYVWGQVTRPGLYIIPDDTDLLALISLAGGPTENAKLSKIRIIRPTSQGERVIYVNLKEYIQTGDEKLIPVLKPGDTVILSGTIYYAFYKFSDFFSKIAIIVSTINAVNNL
jgi:polysaccharide biosynthesis/export protein